MDLSKNSRFSVEESFTEKRKKGIILLAPRKEKKVPVCEMLGLCPSPCFQFYPGN